MNNQLRSIRRLRFLAAALAALASGCSSVSLEPWPVSPPPTAQPRVRPAVAASAPVAASAASAASQAVVALPVATGSSNATTVEVESAAVSARYPKPAAMFSTPAFQPNHPGLTSNAELRNWMQNLVIDSAGSAVTIGLVQAGSSQSGVPIEALHLSRSPRPGEAAVDRPAVLLIGQQHGDEPATSEALMVIAQRLVAAPLTAVLDRVDVVVLPRANPDGAANGRHATPSGIDLDSDHLLLRTPEAQAQAQLVREFRPIAVIDLQEFPAIKPYVEKFGAVRKADALVQYAMVANMHPFVSRAADEWFRRPLLKAFDQQGLTHEWYYTTSSDLADKHVSMGSIRADSARNVNGLRNSVALVVASRGSDLGRAHLERRVQTQVVAASSLLQSAAARVGDLQKLRKFVDADLASKACQGEMLVEAHSTTSEYNLKMLDPLTGADRRENVVWESALELTPTIERGRPCGYWLDASQTDTAMKLRSLGARVQQFEETASLRGEGYGSKVPASPGEHAASSRFDLTPLLIDATPGSYYIGLDQPLAPLIIAALEPDSPSSFAANGLIESVARQARVLAPPTVRMSSLP